jgi:hypothetical protein
MVCLLIVRSTGTDRTDTKVWANIMICRSVNVTVKSVLMSSPSWGTWSHFKIDWWRGSQKGQEAGLLQWAQGRDGGARTVPGEGDKGQAQGREVQNLTGNTVSFHWEGKSVDVVSENYIRLYCI